MYRGPLAFGGVSAPLLIIAVIDIADKIQFRGETFQPEGRCCVDDVDDTVVTAGDGLISTT